MGPAVLVSRPQPDVLLLTLNRPKNRNAVTGEMIDLLVRELDAATHDATVRAVVVAGNPAGRAFCAGADLAPGNGLNTAGRKGEPLGGAAYRDAGGYSSLAALRCTKPIIAAINGSAVGWGLAFPLAADLRVVSETAKLGFTMAARGLVNESCSSWLLPRIVGPTKAKELVFTGRVFLGKDAAIHAPGLFNYVLPQDQVVVKALELAREMASTPDPLVPGCPLICVSAASPFQRSVIVMRYDAAMQCSPCVYAACAWWPHVYAACVWCPHVTLAPPSPKYCVQSRPTT